MDEGSGMDRLVEDGAVKCKGAKAYLAMNDIVLLFSVDNAKEVKISCEVVTRRVKILTADDAD